MIFQRRAKKYDCMFYIGNEKIDIVQSYTYVGTQISSTGNFTLSLEHVREKAVHALFSLRRHIDFSSLKPSLACKIFDTMISPILTYNSEVCGVFIKSDFKYWDTSPIEKGHLQFWYMYKLTYRKFEKRWADVFQIYPNAIHFNPLRFCPSMSLLGFPVFC